MDAGANPLTPPITASPSGPAVRSSSEATTVRPGAASIGISDGTAITRHPAACAEATPFGESSRAKQRAGFTSSSLAASR